MLYYGNSYILNGVSKDTIVYNVTSYREDIKRLNLLPPIDKRMYKDSCRDFYLWYAEWILANDLPFFEFFKVVYDLYCGKDIFLVMDTEADWSENIIESILKLIQQRYGYNAAYIDSIESYIYAANNFTSSFSEFGLYNFDIDKDRYSIMLAKMNPNILNIED